MVIRSHNKGMNAEPPTARFQIEHQLRRPGYASRYQMLSCVFAGAIIHRLMRIGCAVGMLTNNAQVMR